MGHGNGTRDFISGMVWGGLVGAAIGMLMAPRSGEEMRIMLRDRTADLRERAFETAEQARLRTEELQQRSRELLEDGREKLEDSRERLTRTASAVRRSAEEAWNEPGPETGGPAS